MPTLYTIGHSNRTLKEFLAILAAHGIKQIVDVRTIPKSRWVPWTNQDALAKALKDVNIKYHHLPELGGRRSVKKNSKNTGWHKASFQGYADHMQTEEFFEGLKKLNKFIKGKNTAVMCAEAVPWRCHRSMIGDAELVRGVKVLDIISKTSIKEHALTPFAVVNKRKRPIEVSYPNPNHELAINN